jgi:hypothetical protein
MLASESADGGATWAVSGAADTKAATPIARREVQSMSTNWRRRCRNFPPRLASRWPVQPRGRPGITSGRRDCRGGSCRHSRRLLVTSSFRCGRVAVANVCRAAGRGETHHPPTKSLEPVVPDHSARCRIEAPHFATVCGNERLSIPQNRDVVGPAQVSPPHFVSGRSVQCDDGALDSHVNECLRISRHDSLQRIGSTGGFGSRRVSAKLGRITQARTARKKCGRDGSDHLKTRRSLSLRALQPTRDRSREYQRQSAPRPDCDLERRAHPPILHQR